MRRPAWARGPISKSRLVRSRSMSDHTERAGRVAKHIDELRQLFPSMSADRARSYALDSERERRKSERRMTDARFARFCRIRERAALERARRLRNGCPGAADGVGTLERIARESGREVTQHWPATLSDVHAR